MTKTNTHPEIKRYLITKALVDEQGPMRDVTKSEEDRVEELLAERYVDPYRHDGNLKRIGRSLLTRTGVYEPKKPVLEDRPWLKGAQQIKQEVIESDLEHIRAVFREDILRGVDDVAIDAYLNLDSEDSIIPPLFRRLHAKAKQDTGREVTFTEWASDIATDDQLLNLMQWHDTYLKDLDEDPAFIERIKNVKQQYIEGLRIVQSEGEIHPSVLADTATIEEVTVRHASPLSPITPGAAAFILKRGAPEMHIKPNVGDDALFHELTHTAGGFIQQFDEGQVEKMAIAIYNATRPPEQHKQEQDSVYFPQIEILNTLYAIDAETFSPLETSRNFALPDSAADKTLGLIEKFDNQLGFPLLLCLTKLSQELFSHSEKFTQTELRGAVQTLLLKDINLVAKALLSEGRDAMPATLTEFIERFMRMPQTFTPDELQSLIYIAREIHQLSEQEK